MDHLTTPDLGTYTYEQKVDFDNLIESDDALGMYVLRQTMMEKTFEKLYHSFPESNKLTKEQKAAGVQGKGAYQRVVDGLYQKGFRLFGEYVERIAAIREWPSGFLSSDVGDYRELKEEVSPQAWKLIKDRAR